MSYKSSIFHHCSTWYIPPYRRIIYTDIQFMPRSIQTAHTKCFARNHEMKLYDQQSNPDSKVHVAHVGPTWVLSAPGGPHVGPMNFAIKSCVRLWYSICVCWLPTCDHTPRHIAVFITVIWLITPRPQYVIIISLMRSAVIYSAYSGAITFHI